MTPTEKAAQEAAGEIRVRCGLNTPQTVRTQEIITKHLAPLQAELDCKDAENKALRQIVADSVKAIGNGSGCSTEASLDFMQHVPKEISLVVDRKDKLLEEAKDLITRATTIDSVSEAYRQKQQDWIARAPGDRKPNGES